MTPVRVLIVEDDALMRAGLRGVLAADPSIRSNTSVCLKVVDPEVAKLEEELFDLLNQTGIGPMGLGGDVTVLQCHVEHADTHMTLNPVAVNYQCWAARRASSGASTSSGG